MIHGASRAAHSRSATVGASWLPQRIRYAEPEDTALRSRLLMARRAPGLVADSDTELGQHDDIHPERHAQQPVGAAHTTGAHARPAVKWSRIARHAMRCAKDVPIPNA